MKPNGHVASEQRLDRVEPAAHSSILDSAVMISILLLACSNKLDQTSKQFAGTLNA